MVVAQKPLVSVCILSFNRKADVIKTVQILKDDTYGNLEIIIADNNSQDGTVDALRECYPDIQVIEHPVNIGIDALNSAFMAASGEFILTLDDDSWPEVDSIAQAVTRFQKKSVLGLVAFDVIDPKSGMRWDMAYLPLEPGDKPQPWHCFVGCGFMIRTSLMQEIGGYPKDFFLYANEAPLAIEVLRRGFDIEFLPDARVFHAMPQRQKGFGRNHIFYGLRNDLQTAWRYYRGWDYLNVLWGRALTGFILFALIGKLDDYRQVFAELRSYQARYNRLPVDKRVAARSLAAFHGTTLTTFFSYRNVRRALWYLGFFKDGRVVS
jgi:GT2 family glycosyltransferase